MTIDDKEKKFVDYCGTELFDHDGTKLLVSEDDGYQYCDIEGRGFLHDGKVIDLSNGQKQFFLADGKAIIHDGSPIELPDGRMQYFDYEGRAMWPIDKKRLVPLMNKQKDAFFAAMIERINKDTPLMPSEIEFLRLALLAAEHPDSEENQHLVWSRDIHRSNIKPQLIGRPADQGPQLSFQMDLSKAYREYFVHERSEDGHA